VAKASKKFPVGNYLRVMAIKTLELFPLGKMSELRNQRCR
jgi:hypothetical protein